MHANRNTTIEANTRVSYFQTRKTRTAKFYLYGIIKQKDQQEVDVHKPCSCVQVEIAVKVLCCLLYLDTVTVQHSTRKIQAHAKALLLLAVSKLGSQCECIMSLSGRQSWDSFVADNSSTNSHIYCDMLKQFLCRKYQTLS